MYQLAVLYAPYGNEYSEKMEELGRAFKKLNFDVNLRGAKDAGITDILAADVVVFCSVQFEGQSLHPDFDDMVRVFEGINLAGTPELFREALRDTEIGTYSGDLILSARGTEANKVKTWAAALYTGFKDSIHE